MLASGYGQEDALPSLRAAFATVANASEFPGKNTSEKLSDDKLLSKDAFVTTFDDLADHIATLRNQSL